MHIYLQTDRLVLRRFTPADVDLLVDLNSDPAVMRYVSGGRPTPRAVIEDDFLPRYLAYYERYAGFGFWPALEQATGIFVGWFLFRPPDAADPATVELGYRLRQAAWGKGYATEGSAALIRKGFVELGVQRVVATAVAANLASRRVLEKSGLRLTRTYTLIVGKAEPMLLHRLARQPPILHNQLVRECADARLREVILQLEWVGVGKGASILRFDVEEPRPALCIESDKVPLEVERTCVGQCCDDPFANDLRSGKRLQQGRFPNRGRTFDHHTSGGYGAEVVAKSSIDRQLSSGGKGRLEGEKQHGPSDLLGGPDAVHRSELGAFVLEGRQVGS